MENDFYSRNLNEMTKKNPSPAEAEEGLLLKKKFYF
jgi:hypothetical protein